MSGQNRPRYVPSRQRHNDKNRQQRFHGAFTGGFSAGFFNTVGSKEGWKPRNDLEDNDEDDVAHDEIEARPFSTLTKQKKRRPQQQLEDFMDEQDHDEWGGPTSINRDYKNEANASQSKMPNPTTRAGTMEQLLSVSVAPPANVGSRLLRVLGWREGKSSAYVPADKDDPSSFSRDSQIIPEAKVILSEKRLRKVQLQQTRVKIPAPKLDTCGLGYEPFQNAPEFQAYREKRRKLAQERAKLGGQGSNVYRLSNVLATNENDKKDTTIGSRHQADPDDVYVSYETVEDFVGQKSVGGFALREDEDDAYDDEEPTTLEKVAGKVRLDTEAYNQEVYEHSSDEDIVGGAAQYPSKRMPTTTRTISENTGNDFSDILSSFADTNTQDRSLAKAANNESRDNKVATTTVNGRHPFPDFIPGGISSLESMKKRYRGPDIPFDYQVKRHEFGQNEHPMVLQTLSRAVQLEAVDKKRRRALDEALKANASSHAPSNRMNFSQQQQQSSNGHQQRSQAPMAGGAFKSLAAAIKNRFTSSNKQDNLSQMKGDAGLRLPNKDKKQKIPDSVDISTNKPSGGTKSGTEIRITRTVRSFAPHRLLCKRFHVPVPASSLHGPIDDGRVRESTYFQQEILSPATLAAKKADPARAVNKVLANKATQPGANAIFSENGIMKDDVDTGVVDDTAPLGTSRPSMETYKSIFEPKSEDEEEDEDEDGASDKEEGKKASASSATLFDKKTQENHQVTEDKGTMLPDEEKNEGKSEIVEPHDGKNESVLVPSNQKREKKRRKKESKRKRDRDTEKDADDSDHINSEERRRQYRRKRSRSVASESTTTDLSADDSSASSRARKKKRHRNDRTKKKRKKKDKKARKRK